MANEVSTINEQNTITEKLLNDYLTTITDKLNPSQRMQFIAVAQAFNLNPFKREIYATTYRNKDGGTTMSIVTGYEVYLKRAEMNPNYDGFETEFKVVDKQINCTCKVYRKDRRMPITSCVWMSEYNFGKSLWATKPKTMLEKVAIATAFRRAFPTDFGGMPYTTDELPETMTGAARLEQQGHVEVSVEEQQAALPPKSEPLNDKKRSDFLAMVSREANRAGTPAVNALLDSLGGVDSICADRNVAKDVAAKLKALPDKGAAAETETDNEEDNF